MSGLYVFRGVKLSILIPLIILSCMFLSGRGIIRTLSSSIVWRDVFILSGGIIVISVMLLRSGNNNIFYSMNGFESRIRSLLETYLSVRPRSKELLLGHPVLLLALWMLSRQAFCEIRKLPAMIRMLIIAGAIGQISIINTFVHAHTPFIISVQRTLHGIWLGAFMGIACIVLYAKFLNKSVKKIFSFKQ